MYYYLKINILKILDDTLQSSQEKTNPQLKLNHLFGMNQRNTGQNHLNYSYLSTASSHDSEENLMRLNSSCVYSSNNSAFQNPFNFNSNNIQKPNQQSQNSFPNSQYNRVKSMHISSNHQKKIEEQEEKDDEDFILNISKYYINNVEEDPTEILKIAKNKINEEQFRMSEKTSNFVEKPNSNVVFEFTSRNTLDVPLPRKKKNFPESNSEKYDIDLNNVSIKTC